MKRLEQRLSPKSISDTLDTRDFTHLRFMQMVEYMAANKIALYPMNYKSLGFIQYFQHHGRMLIERKYSCQNLDVAEYFSIKSRPSLRTWGNLSDRLGKIFTRWIEIGWLIKVLQLSDNASNLKLQLQGVEAVVLDRFPPSHPLSIWTFIGFVALIHLGIGLLLLIALMAATVLNEYKKFMNLIKSKLNRFWAKIKVMVMKRQYYFIF